MGPYGLWKSDGTAAGTVLLANTDVRNLTDGSSVGPKLTASAGSGPVATGSSVTLIASIADPTAAATITQVAFYRDTNGDGKLEPGTDLLVGYAQTSLQTWTLTMSTTGLAPGTYTLFAQAEYNTGIFTNPFAFTLTVV